MKNLESMRRKLILIKGDLSFETWSKAIKLKTGADVSPSSLHKYIQLKRKPPLDVLEIIAKYADIKLADFFEDGSDIHELLTSADKNLEKRDKLLNLSDQHKKVTLQIEESNYIIGQSNQQIRETQGEITNSYMTAYNIPILGFVPAGGPVMTEENIEGRIPLPAFLLKDKNDFCLRIRGDSMEDVGINDGDLVLIHPQPIADTGQTVIARINGEVTCKRFYRTNGKCRLEPANSKYKPIPCEDLEIVGIVIKVIKDIY